MEIKIRQHTQDVEMTRHIHKDKKYHSKKSRKRKKKTISQSTSHRLKTGGIDWLSEGSRVLFVGTKFPRSSASLFCVSIFETLFSSIICSITRLDVSPQKNFLSVSTSLASFKCSDLIRQIVKLFSVHKLWLKVLLRYEYLWSGSSRLGRTSSELNCSICSRLIFTLSSAPQSVTYFMWRFRSE